MKISELIEKLQKVKEEHGDINVYTQSLSHWPPELDVRNCEKPPEQRWLLLNKD